MRKGELDLWQKLETRAKKLETALRSARIRKASQVYFLGLNAEADEVLFLLYHSTLKPVQERLRNYFQKYLPAVQEITPEEWAAVDAKAGARRNKAREEFVAGKKRAGVRRDVRRLEKANIENRGGGRLVCHVAARG